LAKTKTSQQSKNKRGTSSIKGIFEISAVHITLCGENLNTFPTKIRKKSKISILTTSI
jgi:hypothetical protein